MKLPICERLLCCASLITPGSRVADIGTDHGYLGIYLLQNGLSPYVLAADLREKPLEKAKENARLYQADDRMDFVLSDGLENIPPEAADTIVCAGMGGDLIGMILDACPWVQDSRYTLILQPQRGGQDLRRHLAESGFGIEREVPVEDGGFLYTVMRVRFGMPMHLTPGQQYVSPWLLASGSALVKPYLNRIEAALEKTVAGLERAAVPEPEKLAYFRQAWKEVQEMRESYADDSGNL